MSLYPDYLSPTATPTKVGKSGRSKTRREASGVFSLFQTPQIQQFKEAFSLIDQDGDGIVNEQDLRGIFTNLGITPTPSMLKDLLTARPGSQGRTSSASSDVPGVNFTMFLTMMGEHLFEFDTEAELIEAFESFDDGDTGTVKCDEVRKWLGDVGDRMQDSEIDRLLKGPFTDRQGNFNYREWVKVLRVNGEAQESESS
ncbi:EF-hand [Sistotremastrum niveocremeum HHB9708]|uniref:EF-hand n=1 Tax=Sistotremastrum niveocremeum HHB9708 TaxID=1314777 RepID=A0A164XF35_9AGAM|nr:EF-hand [Sistotremastrum niveocremeum HHB9708]